MADSKIIDLEEYTSLISTDILPIVDVTNNTTKKVNIGNLLAFISPSSLTTKATDYTLLTTDEIVIFTATATATLPAATGTGQTYRIVCRTGTLTIDGNGSDTIKGELTLIITAGSDMILTDTATGLWE